MPAAIGEYRDKRLPPALPGGLPLLGHALSFQRDPVRFLLRARQRLGEVFTFSLAGKRVAFLSGARAHEAFFRAPDDQLNTQFAYRLTVPIFGRGVSYDLPEERRNEQISMVLPAMNERRLRAYAGFIQEEVEEYVRGWGNEGVFDLLQLTNELTLFIASRCLIGREFRSNLSAEFAHLYRDLAGGLNLLAFFSPHLPLPAFWRRDRARRRTRELIGQIIADRHRRTATEEDFLQTLMHAHYRDGTALTDETITGFLLALLFAGQHNSALQAAWTGVELLRRPNHLHQVLREQEEVMGAGRELTLEAIREMVVLERAVQESERLHSPRLLIRKILRNFVYRDYILPAGWLWLVSPAVSHLLPDVFTDAHRYDPERFAPGREEHQPVRSSIITFGGGTHGCIGKHFAHLQVKAIWSLLLRRFELRLLTPNVRPARSTFVEMPQSPCLVAYRRRRLDAKSRHHLSEPVASVRKTPALTLAGSDRPQPSARVST